MTSSRPAKRLLPRVIPVVLLVLSTLSAGAAEEDPPLESQPERVAIAIRFAESPDLIPADRRRLQDDIHGAVRRLIGAHWDVTFDNSPPSSPHRLDAMNVRNVPIERGPRTSDSSPPLPGETAPDKYVFAVIEPGETGFDVTVRQWERMTDSLGPVVSRSADSRNEIVSAFAAALLAADRAVARIEDVDAPRLHFRGGAVPTADAGLLEAPAGTLFRVVLHRRDRDGRIIEIRPIPYTYLELKESSEGVGTVNVHSALRSPLGTRRGRVSAWAVAASTVAESTRLKLLRESDDLPLTGRRVAIRAEPFQPGKEPAKPLAELLTDRSGVATIRRDAEHPLVWATITSGTATLMRLPVAPGTVPEIELRLGNDQRRLDTEGRIAILTGDLVETVAKRATLIATARRASRNGRFEQARDVLDEAETLPASEDFRRRLAAIGTPAAQAAEEAGERLSAARIRALAGKTATLIDRYLESDALRAAREELDELENASEEK